MEICESGQPRPQSGSVLKIHSSCEIRQCACVLFLEQFHAAVRTHIIACSFLVSVQRNGEKCMKHTGNQPGKQPGTAAIFLFTEKQREMLEKKQQRTRQPGEFSS